MKTSKIIIRSIAKTISLSALLTFSCVSVASGLNPLIDDFSDAKNNSLDIPRQLVTDAIAGGGTTSKQSLANGIISIQGEIMPPRGQPGWASTVMLIDPKGLPRDASAFSGIRLLVKRNTGNLSISANSTDVTNFDYHASPVAVRADGQFHEVKIPFTSMKRAWSEQTKLNTKTINGLSIVAYDLQKGKFNFELDEVSFY